MLNAPREVGLRVDDGIAFELHFVRSNRKSVAWRMSQTAVNPRLIISCQLYRRRQIPGTVDLDIHLVSVLVWNDDQIYRSSGGVKLEALECINIQPQFSG